MTNVLVLGGTRFVGRAIVDALLGEHQVTVANRGTQPLWDSRLGQLVRDRTDPDQARKALVGEYDTVVDVSGTHQDHIQAVLSSSPVTNADRYIYISSASVYDRTRANPPFREGDPATGDAIWGDYGFAKAGCENLLRVGIRRELTVLRPPYVYGPRNTEDREQFCWARMLGDQPLFVPADGRVRIQFCHAEALAAVVAAACAGSLTSGTYNVAEPRSYSIDEYIDVLAEAAGLRPRLVHITDPCIPARDYFPFRNQELTLDTTRVAGIYEHVPLAEGLRQTLTWFRSGCVFGGGVRVPRSGDLFLVDVVAPECKTATG